jgi:S1-C subfamily serine protease
VTTGQAAGGATVESFVVVEGVRHAIPSRGLRIGRAPDNDVVLVDPNVSRQHAIVWATPRGAFVRDLGSQNGTFIGARRAGAGPEALPPGSRVRLGQSELLIEARPVGGSGGAGGRRGVSAVLVGLVLAVLLGGLALALSRATANSTADALEGRAAGGRDRGLVRALNGTVQVLVRLETGQLSAGSGSTISPRGHVLTNFHIVGDNGSGQLKGRDGQVIVAIPPNEGAPARPKYLARVAAADPALDFALLRIAATVDGGPLPAELCLEPIPVGDSDTVRIGDPLTIVGYPGVGGQGVTVTRGIHSGLQTLRGMEGTFFKTDTEINPGNSGGTAIDAAGSLVGVPTAGVTDRATTGRLGLVRPINAARALIDRAEQDR